MSGYTNGWADKISRVHSHGCSRVAYAAGYILYSSQRRFFTRRELAAYLTQPLLASAAAAADRQIIRSRPIKGSRRAACTRTYIRGTFVLSRNGIIVHTVGTRYFDYAECALSRPPVRAYNSSLIVSPRNYRARKKKIDSPHRKSKVHYWLW